ncbi:polynucleotide kinase 3'-phosphatase [Ephemerocybe angulata]|uniref:Polynucleotide kinase 3'-phosphatase n=1 Tax=Ephemerocybe angulata TaxID=980116 RepID=A0A8H6IIR2_9AGAR|nr:polynucleotide kinase 3'-phosphatase [Tulosesus angulatus]
MSAPGPSKKRARDEEAAEGSSASAKRKVHPFFQKRSDTQDDVLGEPKPFQWLPSLGPRKTCFHAINLKPVNASKVAALDLDGTVIKADLRHSTDWQWWAPIVPKKLRELHNEGYSIVLISNQNLKAGKLNTWKEKVAKVAKALEDIPFRLLSATEKDEFRKPMPGMYYELEKIFAKDGVQIDKGQSFFVGDAAGRIYSKTKKDFASTDRKWALNVELKFLTPEEYFLGLPPHPTYELPGFDPSTLPELPEVLPSSSALLPPPLTQELVVFVGFPSLGKTSFFRKHFQAAGYAHINQDTLKTRAKCVSAVVDAVKGGKSCVVDNTNKDAATRKLYIDIAKKNKIPIRCFYFTGSIDLAWHNNLYRAFVQPLAELEVRRDLVPYLAYVQFRDGFEEPGADEEFTEIKRVNFVFEGTEEERRRWSMWLQITGK